MNAREKGLIFVREVRNILQDLGYQTEGPGYGVFFGLGRVQPMHKDYFGLFDLMSFKHGIIEGHQVSTPTNKAAKVKAIQAAGFNGYVWSRDKLDRAVNWRVFRVDNEKAYEVTDLFRMP